MRVIELLRREFGGRWTYDRDLYEWVRADGVRVYARSHCVLGENGGERYYSRWYIEWPVFGPAAPIRVFQGDWDYYARYLAIEDGRLPGYVELVSFGFELELKTRQRVRRRRQARVSDLGDTT